MNYDAMKIGCQAGWRKHKNNPVIGDDKDFCFDKHVIKREDGTFEMFYSWRTHYCIARAESSDGFRWGEPKIVLEPRMDSGWEEDVNRPTIIRKDNVYHMWYSGQTSGGLAGESWTDSYMEASNMEKGTSYIGYATSEDGVNWKRHDQPVLKPSAPWELQSLMCPTVIWDQEEEVYKMWYSGGGWFEPNAIGYATSKDGVNWTKYSDQPIFTAKEENIWERERVAGCQVIKDKDWYYMAYIGFEDLFKSRICFARSRDGITEWERHPQNPIISAGIPGGWDSESIYKPFMLYDESNDRWLMWFNARTGTVERIGIAIHDGKDLGF
ncbi:hypothetical protein V7138_23015 [Bacillus sp. JJ1533]|uniref:hypothetical protein n=1 Tax=Bacillus sp. JJ1533 TaxID=3122959 RepID=UPI003000ECF7